jgi:hypothetical protein
LLAVRRRFEALTLDDHGLYTRRAAAQIFRSFDTSSVQTGVIHAENFPAFWVQLISANLTQLSMDQCKADLDANGDGIIQFNELVEWLARTLK